MPRPGRQDEQAVSSLAAFAVLLVAILILLGMYYAYVVPRAGSPPIRALQGDSVMVDYVGTFEDTGFVFDTSLQSVGLDNASFPKAASFAWRDRWQALSFTVGDGTMIRGFDMGVRGLAIGEASTLTVRPEDGYGPADPAKVRTVSLFESVPVRLTMNATQFQLKYGVEAASGATVTDPQWGWAATVSMSGNLVVVTNGPSVGQAVRPYGAWNGVVASIDDSANGGEGSIVVHHLLGSGDVDRLGGKVNGQDFYLSAVDLVAGTFEMNFNRQVVGRTLVFLVTMKTIVRI